MNRPMASYRSCGSWFSTLTCGGSASGVISKSFLSLRPSYLRTTAGPSSKPCCLDDPNVLAGGKHCDCRRSGAGCALNYRPVSCFVKGKSDFPRSGTRTCMAQPSWRFRLWKSCEKRRQMRGLIQGSQLLINPDPLDWGSLFCLRRARNRPASGCSRAAVGPSHQGWPQSIEAAVGSTSPAADRWARAGAARGMTSSRRTGTSFSAA